MTASTEQRLTRLELDAHDARHSNQELHAGFAHLLSAVGDLSQDNRSIQFELRQLNQKFDGLDSKVEALDSKVEGLGIRMSNLEVKVDTGFASLHEAIAALASRLPS